MARYKILNIQNSKLKIIGRGPVIAALITGFLLLACGAFFFSHQFLESPNGFFRSLHSNHRWLVWMFGTFFGLMGLILIVGGFKNLATPMSLTFDKNLGLMKLRRSALSEFREVVIGLSDVSKIEVLNSVDAWIEQLRYLNELAQNPNHQPRPGQLIVWPRMYHFANLKFEELRRRNLAPEMRIKPLLPEEELHPSQESPKFLLRIVLKSHEPLLVEWIESFNRESLEETAQEIRNFLK